MLASILTALLPLCAPIVKWGIDKFVKDMTQKAALQAQFQAFIDKHKSDGGLSASEHQSYQEQINQLNAKSAVSADSVDDKKIL